MTTTIEEAARGYVCLDCDNSELFKGMSNLFRLYKPISENFDFNNERDWKIIDKMMIKKPKFWDKKKPNFFAYFLLPISKIVSLFSKLKKKWQKF